MKRAGYVSLVTLTLLSHVISSALFAGAWTQNQGEGLNISTGQYYQSTNYWTTGEHLRSR